MTTPRFPGSDDPQHPDHGSIGDQKILDAKVIEWLDGELSHTEAASVARSVTNSPALAERVRMLRSARAEFCWGIGESESAPPPATLASTTSAPVTSTTLSRRSALGGKWLLAAAALTIVLTIAYWQPSARVAAAENDILVMRLTSPHAGWDLFSNIRFTIEGRTKTAVPCRIVARGKDETDQQLAVRAVAENGGRPIVPMVLTAEVSAGGAPISGDIAMVDAIFTANTSKTTMQLIDLRTPNDGIAPLLALQLDDNGGKEDFVWGFEHGVIPTQGGKTGFVPTEVGEYRLQLQLRAIATSPEQPPAFATPLVATIGFAVRGIIGEWSEPVDGMRARILASRKHVANKPLAVAVQLRNDSDRARSFNITGHTLAEIPQPFHFDLTVDGVQWQQRDQLAVMTASSMLALPQAVGTVRSMIVLSDYWQPPHRPAPPLRGEHQIGMRFHFKPTMWNNGDTEIWIGMIDTPPVTLNFASK